MVDADEAAAPAETLTAALARSLLAIDGRALPAEVAAKARLCLFDHLASAFESQSLPWAEQARKVAIAGSGPDGSATLIGAHERAAPADATFANAVLGHGLVRDDMHLGSVSHLGAVLLPPLLVLAEQLRSTGPELLAGIVAGYEAGGRLGRAILDVEVARIHRPTGIVGAFAGAAACARLARLAPERYAAALGLAANTAAGYNEWAATGGSEMFLQAGFIARNALTAMQLAAAGAYISPSALEGPAGMLAAFGKSDASALGAERDGPSEILAVFFKEVPACNFAQTAAQAARDLAVAHAPAAAAIAAVRVRVPYAAANYPGCDAPGPFTHALQAKMSIQHNVAAALLTGGFAEQSYVPAAGSAIEGLAARVELATDDGLTAAYPARQGAVVELELHDGQVLTQHADDVAPASAALVRERFDEHAARVLGRDRAAELAACIEGLERESDSGRLLGLCGLAAPGRRAA